VLGHGSAHRELAMQSGGADRGGAAGAWFDDGSGRD
jgi:hypothetical protein